MAFFFRRYAFPSIVLAVGLVLTGCAETAPSRFFLLAATPPPDAVDSADRSVNVGVGPVLVPAYLDRPQIVTRNGPYQLSIAEFERWAEPLDDLIPRVLAENLSARLGSDHVFVVPSPHAGAADYTVVVEILRFDSVPDETAVLTARWQVTDSKGRVMKSTVTQVQEPVTGGYEGTVAALSRTLGALSDAIASAILA